MEPGQFTLHKEKALEKISKYQLPYPDAWVIKLAQGIILAGTRDLWINQTTTETIFRFDASPKFGADLEQSFFEPGEHPDPAWDHFRAALWALGLSLRRPFRFQSHQNDFFWSGYELQTLETGARGTRSTLSVSHRTVEQGKGLPLLRWIQASWLNAAFSKTLTETLFSAPIPVHLDGLRLDGFQRCPSHGFSERTHPLKMFWLEGEPALEVPPGSYENPDLFQGQKELRKLVEQFDSRPAFEGSRAAAVVSAHAYYVSGEHGGWETPEHTSCLYWVKHGVIVQKEEFVIEKSCISAAVFINADDIRTDLTGLSLDIEVSSERRSEVCRELGTLLKAWQPDLALIDRIAHKRKLMAAGGAVVAGLALKVIFPPAIVLTGGGIFGGLMVAFGLAKVDSALNTAHRKLLENWDQTF